MAKTPSEQSVSDAIKLGRQALDLAAEVMRHAPPGIDPMAMVRASKWREIRGALDALDRGARS